MIKYDKLFVLLKERGYNTYRIRKEKVIGQSTLQALPSGEGKLDPKTIDKHCGLLKCQPGDIMEWVPDE